MMEEEKYVSRQGVSRDLLHVVAKFGLGELRQYIQSARNPIELRDILTQAIKWLDEGTFQIVYGYNQSEKYRNIPGCQSFEKAWKQLKLVAEMPPAKMKNRYQILLDSVTFVEADIMRRLIDGKFDTENVKIYYGISEFATDSPAENNSQKGQAQQEIPVELAPPAEEVKEEPKAEPKAEENVVTEEKPKKKRGRKKKTENVENAGDNI